MSVPLIEMLPDFGCSSPRICRKSVLFPEPLPPSRTVVSPLDGGLRAPRGCVGNWDVMAQIAKAGFRDTPCRGDGAGEGKSGGITSDRKSTRLNSSHLV